MFSRTLVRSFDSPADAATTWSYFSDPAAVAAASTHAKTVAPVPALTVGTTWDEYHLEDDCDFDSMRWRCTALTPGRSLTVEGLQAGARQRVTTVLVDQEGGHGVQVLTRMRVGMALRAPGSLSDRLVLPVLLLTPFGMRMLGEALDEGVEDDRRALEALAGRPS